MVLCDRCGKDVYMPFRCNYCGGYFCDEHRLPELHDCRGIKWSSGSVNIGKVVAPRPSDYSTPPIAPTIQYQFRFSEREVRDLGISLALIATITLLWLKPSQPVLFLSSVGILSSAFLLHELAHKFSAQRLGYWAEFRINSVGLLITVLALFSPIKIVAPGAVMIAGQLSLREYGKISLAGPLTNIAQALIYLVISLSASNLTYALANVGMNVNALLALFNLIPVGLFDGAKIFRWDWKIWSIVVAIAGLLFLYSIIL